MQPEHSHRGRTLLLTVTLIALALQALKLGSRGVVLGEWPTASQWGQLALVAWLMMSLWEGKEWARVVSMLYYAFAAIVGAIALYLMWPKAQASLRLVSTLIVVLAGLVVMILAFSGTLRTYMAERQAA
jgi:hypothetical protein